MNLTSGGTQGVHCQLVCLLWCCPSRDVTTEPLPAPSGNRHSRTCACSGDAKSWKKTRVLQVLCGQLRCR
jgi:hypothetical protein